MSIACLFTMFMTLKLCFKIFQKRSHRISSNFAITEATKRYKLPKAISEKNSQYREIQRQVKNVMASLCCHGNPGVNKTWIITNFHIYLV